MVSTAQLFQKTTKDQRVKLLVILANTNLACIVVFLKAASNSLHYNCHYLQIQKIWWATRYLVGHFEALPK